MSTEEIQGVIDGLFDLEEGLSGWELRFVESIAEQFKEKGELTHNQLLKLYEVYDENC